jgi:phospholipid/cholesterol/gamma-HCH transport system ATP-binding protein
MNTIDGIKSHGPRPHIRIDNLNIAYDDFVIQQDLNFTINHGDIFIIMGGSGCGKTTLLKCMIGLKSPATGDIYYHDQNFWRSSEDQQQAIKQQFGVMFQGGALWSSMTLGENISLPLEEFTDLSPATIREVVSLKLAMVGLAGYEDFYPSELSGGMRKRASLARAMALDPEILFFDEPSAGLDPPTATRLDDLILEIRDSLETTIVIVTHELNSIFRIGNNSVFLDARSHTMIASGNPNVLRDQTTDPIVREFLNRGENE